MGHPFCNRLFTELWICNIDIGWQLCPINPSNKVKARRLNERTSRTIGFYRSRIISQPSHFVPSQHTTYCPGPCNQRDLSIQNTGQSCMYPFTQCGAALVSQRRPGAWGWTLKYLIGPCEEQELSEVNMTQTYYIREVKNIELAARLVLG
jgi:hypothetical protein